jgi:hypothetical protein
LAVSRRIHGGRNMQLGTIQLKIRIIQKRLIG